MNSDLCKQLLINKKHEKSHNRIEGLTCFVNLQNVLHRV
jgi:hypothetical protein